MNAPQGPLADSGADTSTYDVVVVGLGPSGAAAANACGQLGLGTLVIERDLAIFERQRAIALDDEALRAIANLGLYNEVTAHMHLGVTARFIGLNGKPFITGPTGPTRYTGHAVEGIYSNGQDRLCAVRRPRYRLPQHLRARRTTAPAALTAATTAPCW
jgi:2-polyprenyl-6-methoxyphenol hydroxylase-like FAD-dependent oxidoreductase